MIKDQLPKDLLSKLNANLESLEIIWNSPIQAELLRFVDLQRASQGPDGSYEVKDSHSFVYKALLKELYVGNAYLRANNDQPNFEISEPEAFYDVLLGFISFLIRNQGAAISNDQDTLNLNGLSFNTSEVQTDTANKSVTL